VTALLPTREFVDESLKPLTNEERGKRAPAVNEILIENRKK
jgi:hypothetical protein